MSKYSQTYFFKSFNYALHGFRVALKSQRNFVRQLIMAILAVVLAIFLKFSTVEFCILFILIAMVLICELLNSVIEFMLDSVFKNKYSKLVEMSKDMAAAAVCVASFCSILPGIALFSGKIIPILKGVFI